MKSLYIIGDSISVHYAPYLERYVRGVFCCIHREGEAEALHNLDLPMGANAGDSTRVLDFVRGKRARGGIDADVLLLNCGLHDIRTDPVTGHRKTSLAGYAANLEGIVGEVAAMKPRLVWVRTTPCDEAVHNKPGSGFYRFGADVIAYNAAADAVMKRRGVPSIDLHTFTANLGASSSLYCDHVHFHEHIREKQAAFIAGWLMHA
ncbi:MAG TPA: SGNH/GDSL hydrolase family protein [Rariglobus sp.]